MENKKDFVFEKPKLPLMFVKECLDAVLKRGGELSNLIAIWDGKLDREEIDYLFSWLDKSGLIERDEKTVSRKLIIDGNAVYEIDEDCMLKRRLIEQERENAEKRGQKDAGSKNQTEKKNIM